MHYGGTAPHPGPLPIGWGEGAWLAATHCRATRRPGSNGQGDGGRGARVEWMECKG
jgi:hypothetical protein